MMQLGTIHTYPLPRCSPSQGESLKHVTRAYCRICWTSLLTYAMELQRSAGISARDGDPKLHTWIQ